MKTKMKKPVLLLMALPVLLPLTGALPGCATAPSRPQTQLAPGVDFTAYESFAWLEADAGDDPLRILDVNIRSAIEAELTKRGYRKVDADADLLVEHEFATEDKLRTSPVRVGIGMGRYGGHVGGSVGMGTPGISSYEEGRLVIHVIDAARKQEVWTGTIAGKVDPAKLDAAEVGRVVGLTLADFPARTPLVPAEPAAP